MSFIIGMPVNLFNFSYSALSNSSILILLLFSNFNALNSFFILQIYHILLHLSNIYHKYMKIMQIFRYIAQNRKKNKSSSRFTALYIFSTNHQGYIVCVFAELVGWLGKMDLNHRIQESKSCALTNLAIPH